MIGKILLFMAGLGVAWSGILLVVGGYAVPGVALLALGLSAIRVTLTHD